MNETKTPFSPAQLLHNPRKFSLPLAGVVGGGFAVASHLSLSFELGDGDIFAGMLPALTYLGLVYFIIFIPMTLVVMAAAFLLGRIIGILITAAIAICFFIGMVVDSSTESQPKAVFRDLIWKDAPEGLPISKYTAFRTFSDGTTHVFVIACDTQTFRDLCALKNLTPVPRKSGRVLRMIYGEEAIPDDTEFYQGGLVEAAYLPSSSQAYIALSPPPPTEPSGLNY